MHKFGVAERFPPSQLVEQSLRTEGELTVRTCGMLLKYVKLFALEGRFPISSLLERVAASGVTVHEMDGRYMQANMHTCMRPRICTHARTHACMHARMHPHVYVHEMDCRYILKGRKRQSSQSVEAIGSGPGSAAGSGAGSCNATPGTSPPSSSTIL